MTSTPARVGVLGGGRMGAGIAHAFLLAGSRVTVIERDALFHFLRESCRQQEVFFLVRVPGRGVDPSDAGWTDTERELLDELRWITTAELRAQDVEVFPESLADLVDELAAGWDGVVRSLGIQSEG